MTAATYSATGTKATSTTKLSKDVFEVEAKNHQLLQDAYHAYLANGRLNLAVTKTRGLVRGGGKKPWKQKGTGRARFGSSRNPIWRGGGIVFGPTGNENYKVNLNVKAKRLAARQALSLSAASSKITVIEDFKVKGAKTAEAAKLLKKIGATGRTLVVVQSLTDELKQATNNLSDVKLIRFSQINVFDVLNADNLVITKEALSSVDKWLGEN
ncbi:MAG TPA: 50S ribosomal protein L4 [Candidatus Saccharimonadales bacterium]